MSKAGRSIKDMISKSRKTGNGNSLTNVSESGDVRLPRISNQKTENFLITEQPESYNFTKTAPGKRDTGSLLKKEMLEGLDETERALLDELVAKIDEQRQEIEKRNQNLFAIQRNFESLSLLCKNEKTENNENRKVIAQLREENNDLTTKHRQGQLRINDLLERIKVLERDSDRMKEAEKKAAKLKEELQIMKDRQKEMERILERKRLEAAEQDNKYKDLFSKNEQFKTVQTAHDTDLNKWKDECERLRAECEGLKQKHEEVVMKNTEEEVDIEEYEDKIRDLTSKLGKYQTQHIDMKENCMIHMDELETARRENAELREKLGKYGASHDSNELQIKLFEHKIEKLEAENADLNNQLNSKEDLIENYVKDVAELKDQLQFEIDKYAKYRDIIMMYEDFQSKNKGNLVMMNQQIAEKYERELGELREELTSRKRKIHELVDEKAKTEFERRQLQNELNGISSEILELREKKTTLQEEIEKVNAELQDKLRKMNKAMRDFSDEAVRSKTLSEINDELKRELEDKKILIHTLENKLASKSNADRSSQMNVDKLNEHIRMLKGQIDDQIGNMSNVNDKTKKLATEKETMMKDNQKFKEDVAKLQKDNSDLQGKIDGLKQDVESGKKALEDQKARAEQEKKQLEAQISNLKEQVTNGGSQLGSELAKKSKEIERLLEDNDKLRNDLTHKSVEYDKLYSHSRATLEDKKDVEGRVEHLKGLNTKYIDEINSKTSLLERNFQEILNLKAKVNNLTDELKRFDGIDADQVKKRIKQLETRESTLLNAILKIEHAEDSLATSLSCCHCMELLKDAVTCVPCGHSYCGKCKEGYEEECKECQDSNGPVSTEFFKNKVLDVIAAKISYNRLTFEAVKEKSNSKSSV